MYTCLFVLSWTRNGRKPAMYENEKLNSQSACLEWQLMPQKVLYRGQQLRHHSDDMFKQFRGARIASARKLCWARCHEVLVFQCAAKRLRDSCLVRSVWRACTLACDQHALPAFTGIICRVGSGIHAWDDASWMSVGLCA